MQILFFSLSNRPLFRTRIFGVPQCQDQAPRALPANVYGGLQVHSNVALWYQVKPTLLGLIPD